MLLAVAVEFGGIGEIGVNLQFESKRNGPQSVISQLGLFAQPIACRAQEAKFSGFGSGAPARSERAMEQLLIRVGRLEYVVSDLRMLFQIRDAYRFEFAAVYAIAVLREQARIANEQALLAFAIDKAIARRCENGAVAAHVKEIIARA